MDRVEKWKKIFSNEFLKRNEFTEQMILLNFCERLKKRTKWFVHERWMNEILKKWNVPISTDITHRFRRTAHIKYSKTSKMQNFTNNVNISDTTHWKLVKVQFCVVFNIFPTNYNSKTASVTIKTFKNWRDQAHDKFNDL